VYFPRKKDAENRKATERNHRKQNTNVENISEMQKIEQKARREKNLSENDGVFHQKDAEN